MFTHAGEEIRFFKSQQWHVTNYALLAYVALAAAPLWMPTWKSLASFFCAVLVAAAAALALLVLRSLDAALQKERHRMREARCKLPVAAAIHTKFGPVNSKIVTRALQAAVLLGAALAISIDLVRIPWSRVVVCLTAGS